MATVAPASRQQDGEMATIFAIPKTAPQDEAHERPALRLREDVIPRAAAGTPLKVYVGGNTAGFEDFSDKVAAGLPVFIAVVIGLSVLLLIMAFRSLWIPLVSAVFNLLSVARRTASSSASSSWASAPACSASTAASRSCPSCP